MTLLDGYSRAQLRQAYADAWRKFKAREPLTPVETLIAEVIVQHPRYHALLDDERAAVAFETVAGVAENPFFHMGLHIAVREQVAIDRPPGIRELQRLLEAGLGDPHRAEHALAESLAETLWEAQRTGSAPDEARYIERVRLRLRLRLRPPPS